MKKTKLTSQQLAEFSQQLSILISSGLTLTVCLEIMLKTTKNKNSIEILSQLLRQLKAGKSFSHALSQFPRSFNRLYCGLVQAAEQSGQLPQIFLRLALHQQKLQALRRSLHSALIYPLIVLSITIVITAIMLVFVIPRFQSLFANFDAELPAYTLAVIACSQWLQHNLWLILILLITTIILGRWLCLRSKRFLNHWQIMLMHLPYCGQLMRYVLLGQIQQTLFTLLESGIPLTQTLKLTAQTLNNIHYQRALARIEYQVSHGHSFYQACYNSKILPNVSLQMIKVGEASGQLNQMLEHSANQ